MKKEASEPVSLVGAHRFIPCLLVSMAEGRSNKVPPPFENEKRCVLPYEVLARRHVRAGVGKWRQAALQVARRLRAYDRRGCKRTEHTIAVTDVCKAFRMPSHDASNRFNLLSSQCCSAFSSAVCMSQPWCHFPSDTRQTLIRHTVDTH